MNECVDILFVCLFVLSIVIKKSKVKKNFRFFFLFILYFVCVCECVFDNVITAHTNTQYSGYLFFLFKRQRICCASVCFSTLCFSCFFFVFFYVHCRPTWVIKLSFIIIFILNMMIEEDIWLWWWWLVRIHCWWWWWWTMGFLTFLSV